MNASLYLLRALGLKLKYAFIIRCLAAYIFVLIILLVVIYVRQIIYAVVIALKRLGANHELNFEDRFVVAGSSA